MTQTYARADTETRQRHRQGTYMRADTQKTHTHSADTGMQTRACRYTTETRQR